MIIYYINRGGNGGGPADCRGPSPTPTLSKALPKFNKNNATTTVAIKHETTDCQLNKANFIMPLGIKK